MLMKKLSEYLFLWTLGGILYYSFEMLFCLEAYVSYFSGSRDIGSTGVIRCGFRSFAAQFLSLPANLRLESL